MKWCIAIGVVLAGCGDIDPATRRSNISLNEVQTAISPTVCGATDPTQLLEVKWNWPRVV